MELTSFREDYSEFTRHNTEILCISVDRAPSLKVFADQIGNVEYKVLSDWQFKATNAYGVLNEEMGIATRSLFLVDKQGILRLVNPKYNVRDKAEYEALKQAVMAL